MEFESLILARKFRLSHCTRNHIFKVVVNLNFRAKNQNSLMSHFIGWSLENCMSRKHLVDKKIISWCFVPSGREFVFNQAIHHTFVPFVSFALLLAKIIILKENFCPSEKLPSILRRTMLLHHNTVVKVKTATMGKKIRWQQIHNASNVDDNVAVLRYFFKVSHNHTSKNEILS